MNQYYHIVFFGTRLADYFYQSIIFFLTENKNFTATMVVYPNDENAPYKFKEYERINLISRPEYNQSELITLVNRHNTVALYFAGWNDRVYLNIAKHFQHKMPAILGIDNPWENSVKQRILTLFLKTYIQRRFSHTWCAGTAQIDFALRLGYNHHQILRGLYSANTKIFTPSTEEKNKTRPKNLLFIGRYVDYKNPHLLLSVFSELLNESKTNGWSITFVGSGPLGESMKKFESQYIHVNDFVEPSRLPELFNNSAAFCLPSHNEHWGVVVHEAAAAGLPLILSDTVFSHTEFLINGYNGWIFESGNRLVLKKALHKLFGLSNESLVAMGHNSQLLSNRINHRFWSANLKSVIEGLDVQPIA